MKKFYFKIMSYLRPFLHSQGANLIFSSSLPKKYLYACKFTEARPDYSQFVIKLQDLWKIEHLSQAPTHLLLPRLVSLLFLFTCILFCQAAIPYILLWNIQLITRLFLLSRDRLTNKPIVVNMKGNTLCNYHVLCIILSCIVRVE